MLLQSLLLPTPRAITVDIQPTLTIRNGYLFNIMVTKDMVLQPWTGEQPLPYGATGRNN
jgi:hypothetical protein